MLQKTTTVLVLLCAISISCSKKNNSSISNNTAFNQKYKHRQKISPMGNIISKMQSNDLIEKNYQHYAMQYNVEKSKYEKNRNYMQFLMKNDVKKIKNITVETMPQENRRYITASSEKDTVRDINKIAHLEIEYIMFINAALLEEHKNEEFGDPIMHPLVYDKSHRNDRHIVMGDEYHQWHSWCEVNGVC
jgi:hypothetical protein